MRRRTAAFDTLPNSATATKVLRRLDSMFEFYALPASNPSTIMHWTGVPPERKVLETNSQYRLTRRAMRMKIQL
jgi:predicted mannosyl-3-phosphoglycerate phosphatase (HAD superfamily)